MIAAVDSAGMWSLWLKMERLESNCRTTRANRPLATRSCDRGADARFNIARFGFRCQLSVSVDKPAPY